MIGAGILCYSASTVLALDNVVKIGATIEVQGINYANNGDATQKKLSTYKKQYGFYSSGNVLVDYQLISENGLKYVAKIVLNQTTRNNRGATLSINMESN